MIAQEGQLFGELAVLGRAAGWPLSELLDLDGPTRRRLVEELAQPDDR